MTDLEMTLLCAAAMGWKKYISRGTKNVYRLHDELQQGRDNGYRLYNPLHDDAQSMALVKRFGLWLSRGDKWYVEGDPAAHGIDENLNRAIVECVAKMQQAKEPKPA